ncbi:MAG: DUF460 domain-containing protein [Methanocorpusculum sp.]|nr:DUF460 domain-containing protein [Methanocorpusculum sp.]
MTGLIFGIDIIKGSVRSGTLRPRFGLIRVTDSRVASEEKNISLFRLLRLINEERPEILAVDSIQEIAKDTKELYVFLSALPHSTKLVQVTGNGIKMETLPQAAARYNLKFDKTNPMEEAKASALVASFGGGYEVAAFEKETLVTVSRGRSLGRGGWSQNRYVRKVHGAVKVRAREIEDKLTEQGLRFTKTVRRAFGGESRILFDVFAERADVPVSSMKSGDVSVKVEGRRKDKIEFVPLSKRPSYIIVGIDPGTTVGLAALDLDGNLVYLSSVRALASGDIISEIRKIGKPALIATDKAEMPFGVEKIRRAFSAPGWTPKKDILIKEKYEAALGYEFNDDHQRDSLSAALMAYASYRNKFDNISRRLPAGTDLDIVRAGILKGLTLEQILSADAPKEKQKSAEAEPDADEIPSDPKDEKIWLLENETENLRKLIRSLSEELESKNKALASLQKKLESERDIKNTEVLLSEEVRDRDIELTQVKKALRKEERRCKNMRLRLERMKHYISLQAGEGHLALKVMQQLSKDQIKIVDDEMGLCEDDILYILKIDGWGMSAVNEIAESKAKAVILPRLTYQRAIEQHLIDVFRKENIAILSGAELSPRVNGKIGVVDETAFTQALIEWNISQEVYLKNKKTEELKGLVDEYQVVRKKEVREQGIDPTTYEFKVEKPKKPLFRHDFKKEAVVIEKEIRKETPKEEKKEIPAEEIKEKAPEKKVEDVLFGVLAEYREERRKEKEQ